MDTKLDGCRWVQKEHLIEELSKLPERSYLYQSPVTSGLVYCDPSMLDDPQGESWGKMRGIIQWYADGSIEDYPFGETEDDDA